MQLIRRCSSQQRVSVAMLHDAQRQTIILFLCAHKPSFILPSKVKFVGAAHVLQNARNLLSVQCFLHSPFSVAEYQNQACSVSAAFDNSYIKRSTEAAHAQTCDGRGCMGSRTQGEQPPPHARTKRHISTVFFTPNLWPLTFVTAFRFVFHASIRKISQKTNGCDWMLHAAAATLAGKRGC